VVSEVFTVVKIKTVMACFALEQMFEKNGNIMGQLFQKKKGMILIGGKCDAEF
jgi:hypothetical protein